MNMKLEAGSNANIELRLIGCIVILASCEHNFIRANENLVQLMTA